MAVCANASFAADGSEVVRTVADMVRDYATFTACKPLEDVWLAQAGDEVAGYIRCWPWTQADGTRFYGQLGFVAPHWRGRGVGTALLAWAEQRQRTLAAQHPQAPGHLHHAFVMQGEDARAALLEKAGYRPVRHFFTMLRPSLDDIADFPLPSQLEVRAVQPEHYRIIWESHLENFHTHWGYAPQTEEDYQAWLQGRTFQPHLWQVAWDTRTGEVAGQVRTFIDDSYNFTRTRLRGWTEFISVREKWRRQGVARALISRSLRAQREAGMVESGLGVDAGNISGATRVYADCGFIVEKRNTAYRKAVAL